MNYLEFVKNEETQELEMIRFRDDALEPFFTKMEEANYAERFELIYSHYIEVIDRLNEEPERIRMVKLTDTVYEMHTHMFTSYLVRLFYESQYWGVLLDVLEVYNKLFVEFRIRDLHRKLTEEPIENFVKEVQIVNPQYTLGLKN